MREGTTASYGSYVDYLSVHFENTPFWLAFCYLSEALSTYVGEKIALCESYLEVEVLIHPSVKLEVKSHGSVETRQPLLNKRRPDCFTRHGQKLFENQQKARGC